MYSYLENVFPKYTNTVGTVYDKLYGDTNLNPIIPYDQMNRGVEKFKSTLQEEPYSFKHGQVSETKNNSFVPLTKPLPIEENNNVGGYYSRIPKQAYEMEPVKVSEVAVKEGFSNESMCRGHVNHIMSCPTCYYFMGERFKKTSWMDEMLDMMAYIVFGIMVLLILDKL